MNILISYAPLIVKGISVTLGAWFFSASISGIIGLFLGILSCRNLKFKKISWIIKLYTFIAKGIPAYVQILIAYFVFPTLTGFSINPFVAACAALGFCSSGYVTEIIAAGMHSIPQGQWDAAFVLGYSSSETVHKIILPQALSVVTPALLGEAEQLLKSTALLATIGVTELTRVGQNIISRELNPFAVYITIACLYLLFSAVIQIGMYLLQQKGRHYGDC